MGRCILHTERRELLSGISNEGLKYFRESAGSESLRTMIPYQNQLVSKISGPFKHLSVLGVIDTQW